MNDPKFDMYKNIVNNYFRTEPFEKAKDFCARDMMQLNQRYITEAVCRNEALNRANKLQKENEELKKDISNMYYEEAVINVICDNFDVTRLEALSMLGGDE